MSISIRSTQTLRRNSCSMRLYQPNSWSRTIRTSSLFKHCFFFLLFILFNNNMIQNNKLNGSHSLLLIQTWYRHSKMFSPSARTRFLSGWSCSWGSDSLRRCRANTVPDCCGRICTRFLKIQIKRFENLAILKKPFKIWQF